MLGGLVGSTVAARRKIAAGRAVGVWSSRLPWGNGRAAEASPSRARTVRRSSCRSVTRRSHSTVSTNSGSSSTTPAAGSLAPPCSGGRSTWDRGRPGRRDQPPFVAAAVGNPDDDHPALQLQLQFHLDPRQCRGNVHAPDRRYQQQRRDRHLQHREPGQLSRGGHDGERVRRRRQRSPVSRPVRSPS